ncbi:MAG TPA: MFS transporter [Jatrophihabitans sp.]
MTSTTEAPAAAQARQLRLITLVLAFACGASVANLYYAQPLLDLVSKSFHVSQGSATIVVTITQIGYALGLAFFTPLGDLRENRSLASRTLLVTAAALVVAALAPNLGVFLAAGLFIGLTSVVAQILVPLAAHLAPEEQRGQFVGRVMSGLLLGILLARSVASLAANAMGWRSIYFISAGLMLLTSAVIVRLLPKRAPEHDTTYPRLIASVLQLLRDHPVLRQRALSQALMFGAFTAYWTGVAYELIDKHGLSQAGVALFALVGASGAASAPIAGRIGDRGYGELGRGLALALAGGALVLAWLGASQLVLLGLAGVLLDMAVQVHQVLSQRDIYALDPTARARLTAAFMTSVFVGGAISSAITGVLHNAYGWSGIAVFGACLPAVGLLLWLARRGAESVSPPS